MKTLHIPSILCAAACGISLALCTACGSTAATAPADSTATETDIVGSWTTPVPGQPGNEQGFTLNEDGTATSINMATLQYSTWEHHGDTLVLSGKSIGNGQTIDCADTLTIKEMAADSMTLAHGNWTVTYHRK